MPEDAPRPAQAAIRTDLGAIFVSMELSRRAWLITSLSPGAGEKMSKHSVPASDVSGLLRRFAELRRKAVARTGRDFPIIVIQEAGLVALRDQHFQFFDSMNRSMLAGSLQSECTHDQIAQAIHEDNEWSKETRKQVQRARNEERCSLAALQGNRFGNQFSKDDMEQRNQKEADGNSRTMGELCCGYASGERKQRLNEVCQGRLTNPA